MLRTKPMRDLEVPKMVRQLCESENSPVLFVSKLVPPVVLMRLELFLGYSTEDEDFFASAQSTDIPRTMPGSSLRIQHYLPLLCAHFNRPIAVLFVRPSFVCVAMTVDDYNRRVGPQNVISEKTLHQAIEKECLMQNRDTQNSSEIIWQ